MCFFNNLKFFQLLNGGKCPGRNVGAFYEKWELFFTTKAHFTELLKVG